MPRYLQLGRVPHKRHTQFRAPDGRLYSEEVFGTRGFSGISSILYHAHPPTQAAKFAHAGSARPEFAEDGPLRHRHLRTAAARPGGDPVSGRRALLANADVSIGLCLPDTPMRYFYKNADGDDLIFVHQGSGRLETLFGTLPYRPGDYLVIPRGTIYRVVPDEFEERARGNQKPATSYQQPATRMLVIESASAIEPPKRYRNEYGQMLE